MIRWIGLAALVAVLAVPAVSRADVLVAPAPVVSYYSAPPVVSYYTPAPTVSYYTPSVSYYAPSVSYYAPSAYYAPTTVSTYRYGLFGRHSVTNVTYGAPSYYAPAYVAPAPVVRSYYVAPAPVYRSYYVPVYP